jgi:hypothetical protein
MKLELRIYYYMDDKHDHETKPTDIPNIAGLGAKPQETSPRGARDISRLCAIAAEINALSESGEDMARLWHLRNEFDAEQLRQINEVLEMERKQHLPRLLEAEQTCAEIMRPFDQAINRTDLTFPEMLFLVKLHRKNTAQLLESLNDQKKQLEQKLQRNRGCRQGGSK